MLLDGALEDHPNWCLVLGGSITEMWGHAVKRLVDSFQAPLPLEPR